MGNQPAFLDAKPGKTKTFCDLADFRARDAEDRLLIDGALEGKKVPGVACRRRAPTGRREHAALPKQPISSRVLAGVECHRKQAESLAAALAR